MFLSKNKESIFCSCLRHLINIDPDEKYYFAPLMQFCDNSNRCMSGNELNMDMSVISKPYMEYVWLMVQLEI